MYFLKSGGKAMPMNLYMTSATDWEKGKFSQTNAWNRREALTAQKVPKGGIKPCDRLILLHK